MVQIPVGIGPPNILSVYVYSGGPTNVPPQLDLTTVVSAVISVRRGDLSITSWPCNQESGTTPTEMLVTHAFAVTDCTSTGNYDLSLILTTSGGQVFCYAIRAWVCQSFDLHETPQASLDSFTAVVQ